MEVKKAIKKIIALSAGAIMVSATIVGAMAADLADYPSPFLTAEKKLDGFLVVGARAATIDVIGSVDISNGLQAEAVIEKSVEGGSTVATLSGDSWKVGTSSDALEISENFDQALTKVSGNELTALKSGSVDTTVGGTAKYDQYIRLEDGSVDFYKNTASTKGATGVGHFLYYASKAKFMNYSMVFTDAWDASLATATESDVTYFEEDQIDILGEPWTVVDATRPQTALEDSLKLILIGGGVPITMQTGDESQMVEVNGVEHEVSVTGIYSTKAHVNIDGTTKEINTGTIQSVGDLLVGITSISTSSKETVADTVKFVVGGQRIELRDNDIEDDTDSSHKLKVGSGANNVANSEVVMRGTDDNSSLTLTQIDINLVTDKAYYLDGIDYKELSGVISNSYLLQALEAFNIDIQYEGLTEVDTYDLSINGGDFYELDFEDTKGNTITVGVAYKASSATNLTWGPDADAELILDPDTSNAADDVQIDDMFILTDYADKKDGKTEILSYTSADWDSDTTTLSLILDAKSGETYTPALTLNSGNLEGPMVVDGVSYTIRNASGADSDPRITIDRDSGTHVNDKIIAKGGVVIWLRTNGTGLIPGQLIFDLAQDEQMIDGASSLGGSGNGISAATTFAFNFTQPGSTDTYITMARGEPATGSWKKRADESNTNRYSNEYGIEGVFETPSSASQTAVLTIPLTQRTPQVFLTSGATTAGTAAGGGTVTQEVVPINVGAAKLDSEILDEFGDDFASKVNVIAVGGPCANDVAAKLMGSPQPCGKDFREGESIIQLFENGDKVSMLVAGWEGPDTKKASEIVASHKEVSGFEGDSIRIKTVDGSVTTVEAEEEVVADDAVADDAAADDAEAAD